MVQFRLTTTGEWGKKQIPRWYVQLFGASSVKQVLLRMAADLTLANLALVLGISFRKWYVGQLTGETSLGLFGEYLLSLYTRNILVFAAFALAVLVAAKIYKPLPTARVGKRVVRIGFSCGLGALIHLGCVYAFSGAASRGVTGPSWSFLFLLMTSARLSRTYLGTKFRIHPCRALRQNRVEDVLVVGGAGFIGSVLTRQLLDAGYRVRVLDLQLFGNDSLAEVMSHPRLEVIQGDFRNVHDVVRSLRGIDTVVHLAAIVGDPACAIHQETTIAVNYCAAKMMAQLSKANGISRFVFASTCSVYGASDAVMDERSALNPVSLYATTKIDAERALLEEADDVFRPTILRIATAYGWSHRPRFDLIVNLLSAKAVTDREITIFNGEQWRPFVNTRDIANCMKMVIEAPLEKVGAEIFNLGDNSQNYTLDDLGRLVSEAMPGTRVHHQRNNEDPRNYHVCFDKIRDVLGFKTEVSLQVGIREILGAVEAGEVSDWRDPIYSNFQQMQGSVLKVLADATPVESDAHELTVTKNFLRKAA